jgi:hypothetical protein
MQVTDASSRVTVNELDAQVSMQMLNVSGERASERLLDAKPQQWRSVSGWWYSQPTLHVAGKGRPLPVRYAMCNALVYRTGRGVHIPGYPYQEGWVTIHVQPSLPDTPYRYSVCLTGNTLA